jgi:hypothetical protein
MKFKNKLDRLLTPYACDFFFAPGEVKEFDESSPYFEYLKNCKDLDIIDESFSAIEPEKIMEEPVSVGTEKRAEDFVCEFCGFVGKNKQSLRMHKMKKH